METDNRHIDITRAAMTLGLWLGLYQTIKLSLIPLSLKHPVFSLLFMAMAIGVPFIAWKLVRNFRDRQAGGVFPFIISWGLSIMTFLFATMISSVAAYTYLRYLDNGAVIAGLDRQMEEALAILATAPTNAAGTEDMIAEMRVFIDLLNSLTPLQATRQIIGVSLSWGNIFSLIIAISTSMTKRTKDK